MLSHITLVPKYVSVCSYRERRYLVLKCLIMRVFSFRNLIFKIPTDHASYVSVFMYLHTKQRSKMKMNPSTLNSAVLQWCFLLLITNRKLQCICLTLLSGPKVCSPAKKAKEGQGFLSFVCLLFWIPAYFLIFWMPSTVLLTHGSPHRLQWVFLFVLLVSYVLLLWLPSFIHSKNTY